MSTIVADIKSELKTVLDTVVNNEAQYIRRPEKNAKLGNNQVYAGIMPGQINDTEVAHPYLLVEQEFEIILITKAGKSGKNENDETAAELRLFEKLFQLMLALRSFSSSVIKAVKGFASDEPETLNQDGVTILKLKMNVTYIVTT